MSAATHALPAIARRALRAWGRTGRAPGYHCRVVEHLGRRLGGVGPLAATLPNGCVVRCDLADEVQRWIWFYGAYEPVESYLFTRLLRPGMTVVDAGANAGQYSLLASTAVGPSGRVLAFEPNPSAFRRLRSAVADNGLTNVETRPEALWGEPSTLRFGYPEGVAPGSNSGSYRAGGAGGEPASAVRLDDVLSQSGDERVDLIKLDVEGAEPEALAGAWRTLALHRPTLLVELNHEALGGPRAAAGLCDLLRGHGYACWAIRGDARSSGPEPNPASIARGNVFFHHAPLPAEVTAGWTLKSALRWARGGRP